MRYDLTHARHDRAHVLAPGLFRSLKRGDRKTMKLDVTYEFGDEHIQFVGPEPLGADDLRILQALVAMAGPDGIILRPEPKTTEGQQLRLLLEPEWEAREQNAMVVKDSYRTLAREAGYNPDSGSMFRHIRKCLERLYTVTIFLQRGKRRQGFRLLSRYASDEADGDLFVALNPRITQAIVGNIAHTRIEMSEVRSIQGDAARIIHQRLCGWIDPGGKPRTVDLDTVADYAWPQAPKSMNVRDKRRTATRQALNELRDLGWTIEEDRKRRLTIARPKVAVSQPPS